MRRAAILSSFLILILIYSTLSVAGESLLSVDNDTSQPRDGGQSHDGTQPHDGAQPHELLMTGQQFAPSMDYHLETCSQCHTAPRAMRRPINTAKNCDGCHNPGDKHLHLAATKAAEKYKEIFGAEVNEGTPPDDLGTMIKIPAGEFIQGSDSRHPDEGPKHTTYLGTYYIDKYEVTNLEYKKFIDATGKPRPPHWITGKYRKGRAYHPVVFVSWMDAAEYCNWVGKELPNEAQWEKAARGTDGRNFPWGNVFDEKKSNMPGLKLGGTMPVGSFEEGKSPYGLYDMTGNVWEWTTSWYKPYRGASDAETNPHYGEKNKILRGGSWFNCHIYRCGISAYTFNRSHFSQDVKNNSFGFRCVKPGD